METVQQTTYEIEGRIYPIKAWVYSGKIETYVPLIDMPMMSDEEWNKLAERRNKQQNEERSVVCK